MLEVRDMTVRYGSLTVVDGLSFTVEPGQWLMLTGPNGAGKSTVVNAIAQAAPYQGQVLWQGRDVSRFRAMERARCYGLLSQAHHVGYAFTVAEVVRLGRYCHSRGMLAGKNDDDEAMIDRALALTGLSELRHRSVLTLSGGELQRAFLAQLFAQDPPLLILDEPTNHLDLAYQRQVFGLLREWLQESGRAVLSVVHDLSLARAYGSHALLLDKGQTAGYGPVRQVLTRERLQAAYDLDVYEWMKGLLGQWEEDSHE